MHAIESAEHVVLVYSALCRTLTSAPAEGPSVERERGGVCVCVCVCLCVCVISAARVAER